MEHDKSSHLDVPAVDELRHGGGCVPPEPAAAANPDPPLVIIFRAERTFIRKNKVLEYLTYHCWQIYEGGAGDSEPDDCDSFSTKEFWKPTFYFH